MKSQKGITMMSLVIYVASFMLITGIVGTITTYFYNNMKIMDANIGSNAEYNKLNLYMAKLVKEKGTIIYKYDEDDGEYITFENGDKRNTFVKLGDILYYNNIKLCSNVDDFDVKVETDTGKPVVKVLFQVSGTVFSTQYVISN